MAGFLPVDEIKGKFAEKWDTKSPAVSLRKPNRAGRDVDNPGPAFALRQPVL